jgi:hypothetical protein
MYYIPKGKTKKTEETKMTRFEKDVKEIEEGNEIEVLRRRKAELEELYKKGRCEKNSFRRQCIAQEYNRKLDEYEQLDKMC